MKTESAFSARTPGPTNGSRAAPPWRPSNLRSLLCVPVDLLRTAGVWGPPAGPLSGRPGVSGGRFADCSRWWGFRWRWSWRTPPCTQKSLREERLHQELAMAREIQQGFLPTEFPVPGKGRLRAVRPLYCRHARWPAICTTSSAARRPAGVFRRRRLGQGNAGRSVHDRGPDAWAGTWPPRRSVPRKRCSQLNGALGADNPSGMFVTLAHGIYQPATGANGPGLRRSSAALAAADRRSGRGGRFPHGPPPGLLWKETSI